MEYQIKQVDIADAQVLSKVNALLRRTFNADINDGKLAATTQACGSFESLYLAAYDHDEVIGFNAFISHDLILNGSLINCYQSCWIATSLEHCGKGVFQSMANTATEILSGRNAAFIFCFPNRNSRPILIGKLGFREIPSLKWQVPNIPFIRDLHVNEVECNMPDLSENVIFQNGKQLVDLKRRIYGDELVYLEFGESFIWGVRREVKKYRVNLQYFEIGGVFLIEASHMKKLFRRLYQQIRNIDYFQLTTSVGSPFNKFFRRLRPANTNDLIVFDLNLNTRKDLRFNFFGGVKDVF